MAEEGTQPENLEMLETTTFFQNYHVVIQKQIRSRGTIKDENIPTRVGVKLCWQHVLGKFDYHRESCTNGAYPFRLNTRSGGCVLCGREAWSPYAEANQFCVLATHTSNSRDGDQHV